LFRKQGSAAVHQNGPIEIRAGSRCLIYREILFLSFSSSFREIVTHRFDVDSPRFRAESCFGRSTGKLKKKEKEVKGRKREREREREGEILAVKSSTGYSDERYRPRREIESTPAIFLEIDATFRERFVIIVNHPTGNCNHVMRFLSEIGSRNTTTREILGRSDTEIGFGAF